MIISIGVYREKSGLRLEGHLASDLWLLPLSPLKSFIHFLFSLLRSINLDDGTQDISSYLLHTEVQGGVVCAVVGTTLQRRQ